MTKLRSENDIHLVWIIRRYISCFFPAFSHCVEESWAERYFSNWQLLLCTWHARFLNWKWYRCPNFLYRLTWSSPTFSCLGRQIIGYKNMCCDAQHPHEHWKYIVMLFCGLICDRKVLALRCNLVWINVVQVSRRFTEICAADYIRRATNTGFWWARTHATGFDGVLKGTGSIITTN